MRSVLRTKKFYFLIFSILVLIVLSFIRVVDNTSNKILACVDKSLNNSILKNADITELSQSELCEAILTDRSLQATCLYNVRQESFRASYTTAIYMIDRESGVHTENISDTIETHCNSISVDERNPKF